MTPTEFADTLKAVKADEALRLFVYDDATGKPFQRGDTLQGTLTVGWGTNISTITHAEAAYLVENRLTTAVMELTQAHPIVLRLSGLRQSVLAQMAYNLGVPRLSGFRKMWAAIEAGDFAEAATQMMDSKWATQVGVRAARLAEDMEDDTHVPLWTKGPQP